MASELYPDVSERAILFLVGAVQFVNILDFMMVMPLGPDFAPALGITNAQLGWVGGSYTAAAAVSGLITSLFIDRLDRKLALLAALFGLMTATALGGFAWNFESLIAARLLAGVFGGPATSAAWAIVADTVAPERRGQAMGKVMGAVSLAAVFGVPFGLEMARLRNWTTPFFTTAAMGAVILLLTFKLMPPMRAHLGRVTGAISLGYLWKLLRRPLNQMTFLYITFAMLASFTIIPNISAYMQYNLHYPRARLGWLYSAGGAVSFLTMRVTGRLIDRFDAWTTSLISTVTYVAVLYVVFIATNIALPPLAFFTLFMFAMGMRNVSSTTLATKIPPPGERAGFMSLFACVQGAAMSLGAFFSAHLLSENSDHSLNGMRDLAVTAALLSLMVPALMRMVERRLRRPQ